LAYAPDLSNEVFAVPMSIPPHPGTLFSRRQTMRLDTPKGVWVVWGRDRRDRPEDTSRVRNLSVGGLFIETLKTCPVGSTVALDFLVEDWTIRATANVRHFIPRVGMGLKFQTIRSDDQARFVDMITRLNPATR
jgi:PilZ domain